MEPVDGAIVNTHQAEAWNGAEGRHWAGHQARWDSVNAGFNRPLLDAAAIGEQDRVLDIGCGNGQTTRLAARRAAGGSALGIDLSGPMLERARASAAEEGVANVRFERGDAQIFPFASGGFDAAISRFGVMFFADPVAAFANIGRALRPGGRLAFVCFGPLRDGDLHRTYAAALGSDLPEDFGRPDLPGPASLSEPARTTDLLTRAGFEAPTVTPLDDVHLWYGRDAGDAAAFLFASGPVRHFLRDASDARKAEVRDAMVTALAAYEGPDGVRLRGAEWLVRAVRP